jgi:hypothetical protein
MQLALSVVVHLKDVIDMERIHRQLSARQLLLKVQQTTAVGSTSMLFINATLAVGGIRYHLYAYQ